MYKKFNFLSIFFIFMLFVLGGLVRSTGSGMGCPDWPKCFGEYIPPTSEQALPSDYESYFQKQRVEKTERFAKLLSVIGLKKQASRLLETPQIQETHKFNVVKAYVEYINRLWGALAGIIVFITLLLSFKYIKTNTSVFLFTLFGFLGVFINALLGAMVVNSNLVSGLVTAHFLAAFGAISFFMVARFKLSKNSLNYEISTPSVIISLGLLLVIIFQTVAGTQVREVYENLGINGALSVEQINSMGSSFVMHRLFAVIALTLAVYQWYHYKKQKIQHAKFNKAVFLTMTMILTQLIIGSLLILTNLQSFSKLFHISIAATAFVLQFYICGSLLKSTKKA